MSSPPWRVLRMRYADCEGMMDTNDLTQAEIDRIFSSDVRMTVSFNINAHQAMIYAAMHALAIFNAEDVVSDEEVAEILSLITENANDWSKQNGVRMAIHAAMGLMEALAQDLTVQEFVRRYYSQKAFRAGTSLADEESAHCTEKGWGDGPLPLYHD